MAFVIATCACAQEMISSDEATPAPYETSLTCREISSTLISWINRNSIIDLEKGQELIVYIDNPYDWHNANMPGVNLDSQRAITCTTLTYHWGGWFNFFYEKMPIVEEQERNTNGNPLTYHFKASHPGDAKITFSSPNCLGEGEVLWVSVK